MNLNTIFSYNKQFLSSLGIFTNDFYMFSFELFYIFSILLLLVFFVFLSNKKVQNKYINTSPALLNLLSFVSLVLI